MKSLSLFVLFLLLGLTMQAQDVLEPEANKKGRWGYVDAYGRVVIKHKYDDAAPFAGSVAIVRKGEKFGFINRQGALVGKIQYSVIEPYGDNGLYLVAIGGKMVDHKMRDKMQKKADKAEKRRTVGRIRIGGITFLKYKKPTARKKTNPNDVKAEVGEFGGSARVPWIDAKWGLCNADGQVLVKPEYEAFSDVVDGIIYVQKKDKYGILTSDGKLLVKPEYRHIGFFNAQGFCWVSEGDISKKTSFVEDKFGIIDRQGNVVIPPKYDYVGTYFDDDDSPYRYYAAAAKRVLYLPFSRIPDSDLPFLWFSDKNLKAGVVDANGKVVIPEDEYTTVFAPTCDMVPLVKKKEMGFFDLQSKQFLPIKGGYTYAAFESGLSCVNTGGVFHFVDKQLKPLGGKYSTVTRFSEGHCVVGHGGKYGVIDSLAQEVIPLQYQNAKTAFHEGLLGVQKDGKWGFIDHAGQVVFPFVYEGVDDFENGFCSVSMNGKFGCMQRDGKLLLPIEWDDFLVPATQDPQLIWAKRDGKFYCYDVEKKALAFQQGYEDATNFAHDVAVFVQNRKFGMVNRSGIELIPARMQDFEMVKEAYAYLHKIEKDVMSEADYQRFLLFRSGAANQYKIGDGSTLIPEDKWDY